jgi:hypothetical protein
MSRASLLNLACGFARVTTVDAIVNEFRTICG